MAVSTTQLVLDQLEPILGLDPTMSAAIPRQVEAQIALQGWSVSNMTDQRAVYIALRATQAMMPRLLIKCSQSLKKAVGGPAETEWQDAVDFLKQLQEELERQIKMAAKEVDPEDALEIDQHRPTFAGIRGI